MRLSAPPIQRRLAARGLALSLTLALLAACMGGGDDNSMPATAEPTATAALVPSVTASAASPPAPTEIAVMTVTMTPRPLPEPVETAIDVAVEEFNVERDRVNLVDYRPVDWPSTALGCPEEGKFYAQIVTPGYEVHLNIVGQPATYHTNQTGSNIVRCQTALK